MAARLRRDVHPAPVRPDDLPQRRGLRRAGARPVASRCSRSASTTCCRSSASPTSATCPATGSSACPSWPGSSRCSPAARRSRSGSPSRSPTGCRTNLAPRGVGVVIEAEHLCMTLRGVRAAGASTVTSALHGLLRDDAAIPRRVLRPRQPAPRRRRSPAARPTRRSTDDEQPATDSRDRRRQPRRRHGGADAARGGLRRAVVLVGDEPSRPTSGRRCPRATCWATTSGTRSSSTRRTGTPSTTSSCASAPRSPSIDRDAHEVAAGRRRARCGYDQLLLTTGSAPRRLRRARRRPGRRALPAAARGQRRLRDAFAGSRASSIIGGGWIGLETAAAARAAGIDGDRRSRWPSCRCCGCSAPRSRRSSPTCTGEHGRRPAAAGRACRARRAGRRRSPAYGSTTAPTARRRPGPRRRRHQPRTPSSPSGAGSTSTTASSSTSTCAPPTPTSTPPVTSRTPSTRCSGGASASSTGRTPARQGRGRRRVDARPGRHATTGCRTSSPTSTTSAWSTPATSTTRASGYDQVVFRGDPAAREFIVFWLRDGRVLAGMNVNVWDVADAVEALITSRQAGRHGAAGRPLGPARPALTRPDHCTS